jgi:hypothetical protein
MSHLKLSSTDSKQSAATRPNHALQRFGVARESRRRILLHRMKQKAAGRVCRAAQCLRTATSCNRGVPWLTAAKSYGKGAVSLSLGC